MSTREHFEAWCEQEGISADKSKLSGVYSFPSARVAWRSWEASRAAALEEAAARVMKILGYPPREYYAEAIRALASAEGNRLTIDGDQPDEFPFPASLTPPLRRVLGMMLWETGPIAHALRATGADIARKAEDEQAVVLHWLVGFVLKHGDDWHKHAAIALRAMTDSMGDAGGQRP